MAIKIKPTAIGPKGSSQRFVSPIVNTRKKVPMVSVNNLRINEDIENSALRDESSF
jgi:hypothetical protein